MARYRTIQKEFWSDPFIEGLCCQGKLLYIYLITSSHTNNLGALEISRQKIAFETGIDEAEVNRLIEALEHNGKVIADKNWLWLPHFIKNQSSTSPKILEGLSKDAGSISSAKILNMLADCYPELGIDKKSIPYPYPMDTLSIPYQEKKTDDDTLSIPCQERELELEREKELELELEKEVELERKTGAGNCPALAAPVDKPVDNCPTKQIIELYHELLPELPQVREWAEASRKMLVSRWREKKERQSLDWWRDYFQKVKESNFLTGKTEGRNGNAPFVASLEWLVRPTNLAKVLNGNYANRKAKNMFVSAAEKGYDECMKDFYGQFGLNADGSDMTNGGGNGGQE